MAALDLTPFPPVQMHPIANGRNESVALVPAQRSAPRKGEALPPLPAIGLGRHV